MTRENKRKRDMVFPFAKNINTHYALLILARPPVDLTVRGQEYKNEEVQYAVLTKALEPSKVCRLCYCAFTPVFDLCTLFTAGP